MANAIPNSSPSPTTPTAELAFRLSRMCEPDAMAARSVTVCTVADATHVLFVDRDGGSDSTGDGSSARPFASLATALRVAADMDRPEVYIATLAS